MRAGFGVGKGVVMAGKVEAAGGGDGLELMVGKAAAEVTARSGQSVKELIARIMEAVGIEYGFETAFVEAGIVGYEGDIGGETVGFKGGQRVL